MLGRMAPDDAADLIMEIDQERRIPILNLLPPLQQSKVRSLLSYNPETAGGLMSPDFVTVRDTATVADALTAVRASTAPEEAAGVVFATRCGRFGGGFRVAHLALARLHLSSVLHQ